MPTPLALCLEDLDATDRAARYLRCVALVGRQPGLRLDASGGATWRSDAPAACELWVSADDRLIAYRAPAAVPVVLRRAGRTLAMPEGKPVVALDQDELELGGRRLRLHVHGAARVVAAPSPLPERSRANAAARMAAVVAVGAAVAGCPKPVEVRDAPPEAPADPGAGAPPTVAPETTATSTEPGSETPTAAPEGQPQTIATTPPATEAAPSATSPEPIEVREEPPDMIVDE